MFKKISSILLSLLIVTSLCLTIPIQVVAGEKPIIVELDGKSLEFDVLPTIKNGRTLMPLRDIFEALGMNVSWDEDTQTVKGESDNILITLQINNTNATVNDEHITLDQPATIISGRTFVPVRFIAESTGAKVDWNVETRTVLINSDLTALEDNFILDFNTVMDDKGYRQLEDETLKDEIFTWGRTPVLGLSNLYKDGITGKGVNVAYIDAPYRTTHEALKDKSIYYDYVTIDDREYEFFSMHGTEVTDLLFSAAPEANLYFITHPLWFSDQRSHAAAIYKIIEINKTLPLDEKIKIIGFSDNPDNRELNKDAFEDAVKVAKQNGIVVFFADDNKRAKIDLFLDRDNPNNYKFDDFDVSDNLAFPVSYVTGNFNGDNYYTYWEEGGTSWTTPVKVGLSALALQINPNLDPFSIEEMMFESAYDIDGTKLINPKGFIELVKSRKAEKQNYYFVVYNSNFSTDDDLIAIKNYSESLKSKETDIKLVDVKNIKTAEGVYNKLKKLDEYMNVTLKGIQIFGSSEEVPTFTIHDKVNMGENGVHDSGTIYTDHFYSNFNNDASVINTNLSMYSIFEEKDVVIDFYPQWDMARLPLGKGEIATYYEKYLDYKQQTEDIKIPLVNFSNPIFASSNHTDDFGIFIKRLDEEFNILTKDDYRLYGNLKGKYPVNNDVIGDFEPENIEYENKIGIRNFVINSHGQIDNIDKAYFTGEGKENEVRESFLNNSNVNDYLDNNYYNLYLWDCWGATELNDKNITQLMMKDGKAVNLIASTYVTSNNGMNVNASVDKLLGNNGISLFYNTVKGIYYNNYTWSESFAKAKRLYITNILQNQNLIDGNYQFNLNNSLELHYLGLLEESDKDNIKESNLTEISPLHASNSKSNNYSKFNINDIPTISSNQNDFFAYEDDGKEYLDITYRELDNYIVNNAQAATDGENIYIKIKYDTYIDNITVQVFLAGSTPGLNERSKIIYPGDHTIILKFDIDELISYKADLAFNFGCDHIFINNKMFEEINR